MLWCNKCEIEIDEDEAQSWRDGDRYDPDTNFWYVCPYCLEPLDENEQVTEADPKKLEAV